MKIMDLTPTIDYNLVYRTNLYSVKALELFIVLTALESHRGANGYKWYTPIENCGTNLFRITERVDFADNGEVCFYPKDTSDLPISERQMTSEFLIRGLCRLEEFLENFNKVNYIIDGRTIEIERHDFFYRNSYQNRIILPEENKNAFDQFWVEFRTINFIKDYIMGKSTEELKNCYGDDVYNDIVGAPKDPFSEIEAHRVREEADAKRSELLYYYVEMMNEYETALANFRNEWYNKISEFVKSGEAEIDNIEFKSFPVNWSKERFY